MYREYIFSNFFNSCTVDWGGSWLIGKTTFFNSHASWARLEIACRKISGSRINQLSSQNVFPFQVNIFSNQTRSFPFSESDCLMYCRIESSSLGIVAGSRSLFYFLSDLRWSCFILTSTQKRKIMGVNEKNKIDNKKEKQISHLFFCVHFFC